MPHYTQHPDFTTTPTLYAVATSHLDTQWRWDIQEVIRDLIPATMRDNLALFEKFPNYTFSFEGSIRYQFMEEYYPEDFERVKAAVAADRWHVCGSSVDAGDVNCVSPESLVRHTLYGNGYFRETFGKESADVFLPDCFGFGWALPSIMAHCGLKGFSTQKLTWGSAHGTPFSIGLWQGVDGSRIVATVDAGPYSTVVEHDLADDEKWAARIQANGEKTGLFLEWMYFGVGDRGGAPTEKTVDWVEKAIARADGKQRVVNVPADMLHKELTDEQKSRLPVWNNELIMTRHAIGGYTSQALMKRWNRASERLSDAAERACVAADWLGAATYPSGALLEAWTRFLWNQMHDILPGTCIPRAYEFAWNDEVLAQKQFAACLTSAMGGLCRGLDTDTDHPPVVVANTNAFAVTQTVEASVCYDGPAPFAVQAHGPDGVFVPTQSRRAGEKSLKVRFLATAPACGAAVYTLRPQVAHKAGTEMHATPTLLESDRLRVQVDANGDVCSILDKKLRRELLKAPIQLQLLPDAPREWPAWEIDHWTVTSEPSSVVAGPAEVRVVEHGPARAALEITRHAEGSTFRLRVAIEAGSPRVDFDLQVHWQSRARLLKAAFPVTAHDPKATYDLGLGVIERGLNTPQLYEVPAQQWADITDVSGAFGVAIMNDSKHGWDHPAPNVLRLSLLRTPGMHAGSQDKTEADFAAWFPDQDTQDLGPHRMAFAVMGHEGDWRNGVRQASAAFNHPLRAFLPRRAKGPLGATFSFLEVRSPQVLATTLKKAEDGDGFIVRLQELWGREAKAVEVAFAGAMLSAEEVDGQERKLGDVAPADGKLLVDFAPHKPRAFRVRLAAPEAAIRAPRLETVPVPATLAVATPNAARASASMDDKGRSYPAKLLRPGKIEHASVPFTIAGTQAAMALPCEGQEIALPDGDWDRVHLLVASIDGDADVDFHLDGKAQRATVHHWTDKLAAWIGRVGPDANYTSDPAHWTGGFIKPADVAHTCTHRHDGKTNADEPYEFCHLFRVSLSTHGAKTLTLPKNGAVRLFAVTMEASGNSTAPPAAPLIDRWETLTSLA